MMSWTLFEHRYRDAGNYKASGTVALKGTLTPAEAHGAIAAFESGDLFIAEQTGVPPLYDRLYRWSGGPTSDDHCWHEFVGFLPIEGQAIADNVVRLGSVHKFAARLAAVLEWQCDRSPHFAIGCLESAEDVTEQDR